MGDPADRPVEVGVPRSESAAGTDVTGRFLVLLPEDVRAGIQDLHSSVGLQVQGWSATASSAPPQPELSESDALVLEDLGVAVVRTAPDQTRALGIAASDPQTGLLAVEPEHYVYAISDQPTSGDYLRGYRDAVNHLADGLSASTPPAPARSAQIDETNATWGLQAVKADSSRWTGGGVRVAVLDTGVDLNHPDFATTAPVQPRCFVAGNSYHDGHGHGTHCAGTVRGPAVPAQPPRYGVAPQAALYAGKVLDDQGRGVDGDILSGIAWAIESGCAVISMSLGAALPPGAPHSQVFERVAQRALRAGSLIVAAAGNDSNRQTGTVQPVSHPANCPSILAVAALDSSLAVASFSNGSRGTTGGQVDLAGPGVDVRSSWPGAALYRTISGTSMATPHVAGVAALHLAAEPAARGAALMGRLLQTARRLSLPSTDIGAGLVQSP